MNIEFKEPKLKACQAAYNKLDPEKAMVMSHFDLAKDSEVKDLQMWKDFLSDLRVVQYLDLELTLFKQSQQRKLIQKATSNDKSVGTAQMINALNKTLDMEDKSGNIFIYTYVPPNTKEAESLYASAETEDIFDKKEEEDCNSDPTS